MHSSGLIGSDVRKEWPSGKATASGVTGAQLDRLDWEASRGKAYGSALAVRRRKEGTEPALAGSCWEEEDQPSKRFGDRLLSISKRLHAAHRRESDMRVALAAEHVLKRIAAPGRGVHVALQRRQGIGARTPRSPASP
jgi:hypothetical protein